MTAGTISSSASLRIASAALTVRDLHAVGRFYRSAIGLTSLESGTDFERLGVGRTVLLELRHDPAAPLAGRRAAGLFHLAFLVPTRRDLGDWLRHAAELGIPIQGAADHGVSEAIYLHDPEGNGIEIYADRSSSQWRWTGSTVFMTTDPLDTSELLLLAPPSRWKGLPNGTVVGHVHLQVGALAPAEAFFGALGFDVTARYPGGSFFGVDGYHHHFAANIWNSRNAAVRSGPGTGLANVAIMADAARMAVVAAGAAAAGIPVEAQQPSRFSLRDPWGTRLTFIEGD